MSKVPLDVSRFDATQHQPETDSDWSEEFAPPKRPFGVTLVLWMVLSLSVWGLLRLFGALSWWDVLSQFRARLGPLYLSITGAGWALVGAVLVWSILSRRRWARLAIPISIIAWLITYWIERLFFEAPRANLPFTILLSVFILAMTLIVAANRKTKNFFRRSEEHEQPEDSTPA